MRIRLNQGLAVLLLAMAMTVACEGGVNNPAAPTASPKPAGDASAFNPLTVTFNLLSGEGTAITTYGESGVVITSTSGKWETATKFGAPEPSARFNLLPWQPIAAAEIRVSVGGSPFTFTSVDLYASATPIPYKIAGFRHATRPVELSGTLPNTHGQFVTLSNPHADVILDTLLITVSNPHVTLACCPMPHPVGLDNLRLRR